MLTNAPRGTKDWFDRDMLLREKIEGIAKNVAKRYNFKEIITPAFEHTDLFHRGVGDDTDIVQKEMYTFLDKGGRSISLKPEGTAPVIRAYIEHNMYANQRPTKLFYITQAFRYEKPGSGRLRQHHQIGCELIGASGPLAEFEVINFAYDIIKKLGLKDIKLHINSLCTGESRRNYTDKLLSYLEERKDGLCKTCLDRMNRNPLRVLDCKMEKCQETVKDAPRTIDFLSDEDKEHMDNLIQLLENSDIEYKIDTNIVRGLDYYTKTVFEFVDKDGFTLCGGGRYDNLVKEIDEKQDIPSVGFGMGIERIIYFLDKEGIKFDFDDAPDLFIGIFGDNKAYAYELATSLRSEGLSVEVDLMDRSVKAQMKYANKIEAKYTMIVGDEEANSGIFKLKDMKNSTEKIISREEILEAINGKC